MDSFSASDYRSACRAFLALVRRRPGMYFRTLPELSAVLHGHGVAFLQLGLLANSSDTFNQLFGAWLSEEFGVSASAGWAEAIQELAANHGQTEVDCFFDLVHQFLTGGF